MQNRCKHRARGIDSTILGCCNPLTRMPAPPQSKVDHMLRDSRILSGSEFCTWCSTPSCVCVTWSRRWNCLSQPFPDISRTSAERVWWSSAPTDLGITTGSPRPAARSTRVCSAVWKRALAKFQNSQPMPGGHVGCGAGAGAATNFFNARYSPTRMRSRRCQRARSHGVRGLGVVGGSIQDPPIKDPVAEIEARRLAAEAT